MVDASHGNSGKDHRRQPVVAAAIAEQVAVGEHGLTGVMLESFLRAGRQEPGPPATLTYGQSVTDACMDLDTTAGVLQGLAAAVRSRRKSLYPERALAPLPRPPGHPVYDGTAGSLAIAASMRSCGRSKSTISPVRYFS